MKLIPLDNWLIVKVRPFTDTVGNLALPGTAENSFLPILGDVLASGPGRRTEDGTILPMRVKAGDTILMNHLTARRMSLELGDEINMLREHEVSFVVSTEQVGN